MKTFAVIERLVKMGSVGDDHDIREFSSRCMPSMSNPTM